MTLAAQTLTPINLDRGMVMRMNHKRGIMICAYLDDPGVYYAPNGAPVSAELALEAGFEVDDDLRERARRERQRDALAAIDKEFGVMAEGEVIQEAGAYRVVHTGYGWFDVIDSVGASIAPNRMRREQAIEFLDSLTKAKEHLDGTKKEGRQGPLKANG